MAITYTVAECEAKIVELETELDDLAVLPTGGTIGKDRVHGLDRTQKAIQRRIDVWTRRLLAARNGGAYCPVKRVL